MGRKFQYTTLDRVISKLYRDLGLEEISETDIVEWAGEALEAIGAIGLYEDAVAFIEVKNHKATLPIGIHTVTQIARNNKWEPETTTPANILLDSAVKEEDLSELPTFEGVVLDCNGTPVTDYEVAYYRPYFDLQYEYSAWMGSGYYEQYTPVRLADHSFFESLVCPEAEGLYSSASDEYTIQDNTIKLSFQEGSIAIAYSRQKVDPNTGYPMIPDDISVITAITKYITYHYMARMWYMGREGFGDKMQKSEADWQWYCKQAGNAIMKPFGVDEHQNMLEQRYQLIPNRRRYYGYFGNLSRPEPQQYRNRMNNGNNYGE